MAAAEASGGLRQFWTKVLALQRASRTRSWLSAAYIVTPTTNCRRFAEQLALLPFSFARDKAGKSIAARMAIIAITTSSSIKVKPLARFLARFFPDTMAVWFESSKTIGSAQRMVITIN